MNTFVHLLHKLKIFIKNKNKNYEKTKFGAMHFWSCEIQVHCVKHFKECLLRNKVFAATSLQLVSMRI
jgi:hypothetical protein